MSDNTSQPTVGKFVTGSLMRHVAVMSLSGALGLSFTFLVDFLALFWISRRGIQAEMAAVGIAGTIQFAILSLGIGMMIGAVALVARSIGMGDRGRARRIAATAMVLTVLVQTVLSLLIWVFREPILSASGAEGAALPLAVDFLAITLPSMPLIAAGILASTLLRTIGDAWRSMAVTMAGGAVAMVLDPLLIVWMDMGILGAGWSIVVARVGWSPLVSGLQSANTTWWRDRPWMTSAFSPVPMPPSPFRRLRPNCRRPSGTGS